MMPKQPLDSLKERLLEFFSKYPKQKFKPPELVGRLSLNNNECQILSRALTELYHNNQITRTRRQGYSYVIPSSHIRIGEVRITKEGFGSVKLFPPHKGEVIVQQKFLHTALEGDTVKVAVFAASSSNKSVADGEELPQFGEIVDILQRGEKPIVGTFQKSKHFFFVTPDDNRIRQDIYIPNNKTGGARAGQKVAVVIDEWQSRHHTPHGRVIEVLGTAGEVHAEMATVARRFQLPLMFPQDVLAEAEKLSEDIPREEIKKRLDLREMICFTIDPDDAKDFDDAVSLQPLDGGEYLLGVHIADVSHYVREGTALDREAFKRGTSVYLANEVIPMLPEKLSNVLCSLRPHQDRLTYSVMMTITPKGKVKNYSFEKSVIHSKRRFTYEEVQKIIETKRGDFAETILAMHNLSQTLLKKRMREGSLDFETVETKFRFDEHGKPIEIMKKVRLDAHRLVEEFMLMANQVVATHIGLAKREENLKPFLYRIHDKPDPEKLQNFAEFVDHLGYTLNLSGGVTSRALQKLLLEVKGKEEEYVINEVAIRSMAKAIYSETNIGHFGLAFRYYTHFTSPIRRYPDLIVHRLLQEYNNGKLSQKRREHLLEVLPDICKQSSDMERKAMEAERESVKVMQVEYMRRHVGDVFHAIISGVANFGLFVEITDLVVEGLIRVRDLEDDYYVYDEKKYALIGRRTKKQYRLGDKVTVQVVRVDPEEREIDFVLVE
jgi:ribonuclease R